MLYDIALVVQVEDGKEVPQALRGGRSFLAIASSKLRNSLKSCISPPTALAPNRRALLGQKRPDVQAHRRWFWLE